MSDNTVSRLRREVEELENWKDEQQSALMKISFQLLNIGCPCDGVVDGTVWAVARVRELENKTADLAAENARLREWNQRLWTDVLHWLQLAKNQREWFRHNHEYGTNAGPCPTDAAIEQSERLLTAPKETP